MGQGSPDRCFIQPQCQTRRGAARAEGVWGRKRPRSSRWLQRDEEGSEKEWKPIEGISDQDIKSQDSHQRRQWTGQEDQRLSAGTIQRWWRLRASGHEETSEGAASFPQDQQAVTGGLGRGVDGPVSAGETCLGNAGFRR